MFPRALVDEIPASADGVEELGFLGGLDEVAPGPELGWMLADIDVRRLSGYDRVLVLRAHQRLASHYEALVYEDMVAVFDAVVSEGERLERELGVASDAEEHHDVAVSEIRSALRLTRRAAEQELWFASQLVKDLPSVWESLWQGMIDVRRAKTFVRGLCHLAVELGRRVADGLLDAAGELTSGQLRVRLGKACFEADPEDAKKRYEVRVSERRVSLEETEDGTANWFGLDLPAHRAVAARRRVEWLAERLKTRGETRSMDQLRADVFLDLLCGEGDHDTQSGGGMVDLRVDLPTLAGLVDNPGELSGFGPVISDIARQVAAAQAKGEWRYTVTDPETGRMLTGITRRRPTASLRRAVEARDVTCVFPGCRMPASECDLDHRTPWAQSHETREEGLEPLCRHDHTIKPKWQVRRLPDGSYEWTSPLGHTYIRKREPP